MPQKTILFFEHQPSNLETYFSKTEPMTKNALCHVFKIHMDKPRGQGVNAIYMPQTEESEIPGSGRLMLSPSAGSSLTIEQSSSSTASQRLQRNV